jgi:hypothetical protein
VGHHSPAVLVFLAADHPVRAGIVYTVKFLSSGPIGMTWSATEEVSPEFLQFKKSFPPRTIWWWWRVKTPKNRQFVERIGAKLKGNEPLHASFTRAPEDARLESALVHAEATPQCGKS